MSKLKNKELENGLQKTQNFVSRKIDVQPSRPFIKIARFPICKLILLEYQLRVYLCIFYEFTCKLNNFQMLCFWCVLSNVWNFLII